MKKILILILIGGLLLPATSYADYIVQVPQNVDSQKLLKEVGINLNADEYVAQIQDKNIKDLLNFLLKSKISKTQKGALMDVADQLNIPFDLTKQNLILYQDYLNVKKKTNEMDIVYLDENKQSLVQTSAAKIKQGISSLKTITVKKFLDSNILKESNKKREYYLSLGAKIERTGFLSIEDENEIKKSVEKEDREYREKEDIERQKAQYLKNRRELAKEINNLLKNGTIPSSCQNMMMAENYANYNLKDYKAFFPELTYGKFKITQKYDKRKHAILTPSFAEIKNQMNENGMIFKEKYLKNNLFLIEVADGELYKKMISIKIPREISKNLQQTNLNDLALLSVNLEEKDKKDFFQISKKLIEYNSMVCIY